MWHWLTFAVAPALAHELEVERSLRLDIAARLKCCEAMWTEDQQTIATLTAERNDLERMLRELGKEIEP